MSVSDVAHSVPEARKRLGNIGHTKFYQLAASGKLKVRKLAGRTVVLDTDLAAYLASLPLATEVSTIREKQAA